MATVRLQRRSPRPPRRRLRAAGNGPRTRGHALPAPWPWPHRAPGPRDAASLARPLARSAEARRAPAWHPPEPRRQSFPARGRETKAPPESRPNFRGPGPRGPPPAAAPSAGGARRGTCSSLFSVQPGAAYVQPRDVGWCPWGDTLGDHPGKARDPARPEPRPPDLPPRLQGPCHPKFCPVLDEKRSGDPPRTGRELATFTLLFKLAGRHHPQITWSCRAAGRDSARISLLPWSRTLRRKPGRSSEHVVCHVRHKKAVPRGVLPPRGRRQRGCLHPQVQGLGLAILSLCTRRPWRALAAAPTATLQVTTRPTPLGAPQAPRAAAPLGRGPEAARRGEPGLRAGGRVLLSLSHPSPSGVGPTTPRRVHLATPAPTRRPL